MATIDLKQLVGRLNEPCRRALEAAAGLTLSRTHYNVEIEHWLLTLADRADSDIAAILRHYEIDQGRFATDLNRALDTHEDRQRAARRRWHRISSSWPSRPGCWPRSSRALRGSARAICSGRCWPTRRWRGARARRPASC